MSGTIFKNHSCVNDWISSLWSFYASFMESFSDSTNVLRRYASSCNFIDKLVSGLVSIRIDWFDVSNNSSILSSTSRLFFMEIIERMSLSDGLSIVDSWLSCFAFDSILSFDSFDVDLEMELSHATDDHFLCLFVYIYEEGGILSFEF